MLTALAVLATSIAVAGCGGKSSSTKQTTSTTHSKHVTNPKY